MDKESPQSTFITKDDSKVLKGIAVIVMVAGHITTANWIINLDNIKDIYIFDSLLTSALIDAINFCVAIFAFVTGYGWTVSNKSDAGMKIRGSISRITKCYVSYWIVLLFITLPFYIVNAYMLGQECKINIFKCLMTALGLSSEISKFNWYISFYHLAVITFPLYNWVDEKTKVNPLIKIVVINIIFIGARFVFRTFYEMGIIHVTILNYLSRYNTTMPSILIGMIVAKHKLFHNVERIRLKKKRYLPWALIGCIGGIEFVLHTVIGMTSSLDNIWVIFIVYSLVEIFRDSGSVTKKRIRKILGIFGTYSLYIWLIHSIFIMEMIQPFTYATGILIISVVIVLLISFALSIIIKKLGDGICNFTSFR